jgi:hypothetical protein
MKSSLSAGLCQLVNNNQSYAKSTSVTYAANLVHTKRALSRTVIDSHQGQFQAKPAALLFPIDQCGFSLPA